MNCYEYEGKCIFKKYGIPIPEGKVVTNIEDAIAFFRKIQCPSMIKAQVLSGKRGKAGGIKIADNLSKLEYNYNLVKNMLIYGEAVEKILLEKMLEIEKEFYLAITIDSGQKAAAMIFALEGGMDIEEIANKYPDKTIKHTITKNLPIFKYYEMLAKFNLDNSLILQLGNIMFKLAKLFFDVDATTAEINPLVLNKSGLIAADSKLVIDDSALFRQKQLGLEEKENGDDLLAKEARKIGLSYVALDDDGYIGSIAGGAGLALATIDTIHYCGGKPANFLDIGGGVTEEKMAAAVKIIAFHKNIKGILINVFGGINNCVIMARGIIKALEEEQIKKTIVVKMRGHSQEEGWQLLQTKGIKIIKNGTTEAAVAKLLDLMKGESENVCTG